MVATLQRRILAIVRLEFLRRGSNFLAYIFPILAFLWRSDMFKDKRATLRPEQIADKSNKAKTVKIEINMEIFITVKSIIFYKFIDANYMQ
jgi:hypothetical protein